MSDYYLVKGDRRIELAGEVVFGRSDNCDVKLTEGHPSRRHAKVSVADDEVWVEDLGSANGTFVNGTKLTARTKLNSGDIVSFHEEEYRFEGGNDDDQATVVRPLPTEQEDATVVRPLPDMPAVAPTADAVPKSWADPDYQNQQSTRMLTPEQLRAMAEGGHELGEQISAPHLAVRSGKEAGAVLRFNPDASEWSIGTDADHDLVLSDEGVSAFHAKIAREGERWKLIDQMSANGTFVNDQKTTVGYLASGDHIRFGPVECVATLPEGQPRSIPATPITGKAKSNTWLIAGGAAIATIVLLAVISQLL